jgi:hypothetical protein
MVCAAPAGCGYSNFVIDHYHIVISYMNVELKFDFHV